MSRYFKISCEVIDQQHAYLSFTLKVHLTLFLHGRDYIILGNTAVVSGILKCEKIYVKHIFTRVEIM